jgi:hypothetical protein
MSCLIYPCLYYFKRLTGDLSPDVSVFNCFVILNLCVRAHARACVEYLTVSLVLNICICACMYARSDPGFIWPLHCDLQDLLWFKT